MDDGLFLLQLLEQVQIESVILLCKSKSIIAEHKNIKDDEGLFLSQLLDKFFKPISQYVQNEYPCSYHLSITRHEESQGSIWLCTPPLQQQLMHMCDIYNFIMVGFQK